MTTKKEEIELKKSMEQRELMEKLHEFNKLKDATQKIVGAIANKEGKTLKQVHEELNLPLE